MSTTLNSAALAHAKELIAAGKMTDAAWSLSSDEENAMLGPNGDDWSTYSSWHLAVHTEAAEETKARYGYPFGKDGQVYRAAVAAAKSRAAQQGAASVEGACSTLMDMMDAKKSAPARVARDAGKVDRVWSKFVIKSIDEEQRVIEGIASTPSTDLMEDQVDPMGGEFDLPIPFLMDHGANGSDDSVGHVIYAKPTKEGIPVRVQILRSPILPALDRAWEKIKLKLVNGFSIGFQPLEWEPIKGTYGYLYKRWKWLELSGVVIPANPDCTITSIKSLDLARRAASGRAHRVVRAAPVSPGASGTPATIPKGRDMNIAEQLRAFEAKRAANTERMNAIMAKSAEEGRTLEEAEEQEYDALKAEVAQIDKHIARLKEHEAAVVAKAVEVKVDDGTDPEKAAAARAAAGEAKSRILSVRPNVEKGIPFVRYVKALVEARGMIPVALQVAQAKQAWKDQTPEVEMVLRAAVAAGDTTTAGWASELVYNQNLASAFLEFLRPMTILGKIDGFTRVPFNVRWATQTSGATGYWVGQGKPVPVSKLGTGSGSLGIAKAAGLIVLDQELMRSSDPSAELLVRNDLAKTIAQFLDVNFIAPDYAAVANVNPASITNGVTPQAASGTASADLRKDAQDLFATADSNNLAGPGFVWITTPKVARAISLMLNSLGQPLYPTVTPEGGTFLGYPLIVSLSAMQVGSPVTNEGNLLVLCHAPSIAMADDGGVTIDASAEASIEMLDNPTNDVVTPTATTMTSMFQTNSVAIRATRFINWSKRRTFAVQYIKDANYTA